jgi:hypothetical protein
MGLPDGAGTSLLAGAEAEAYDCHHHDSESKRRRGEDDHGD